MFYQLLSVCIAVTYFHGVFSASVTVNVADSTKTMVGNNSQLGNSTKYLNGSEDNILITRGVDVVLENLSGDSWNATSNSTDMDDIKKSSSAMVEPMSGEDKDFFESSEGNSTTCDSSENPSVTEDGDTKVERAIVVIIT